MSKRLQVLLDPAQYREIQRLARLRRVTLSAWVREALREASRMHPSGRAEDKLRAVRAASRHHYPSADIDQILSEIERGYGAGTAP